ncbi:EAL domain-containing protein [Pseudomonas sp. RIT-PI-AD]|uniref:bifunctional diguanylate cyclase/phosphodiesterase n=1 Tax=Pseudomonas sp. RIT-PI-AD TaxID=3035294 RepID=UPI0021D85D19|nr:EAL domain-containing protein [Pseudomonas sp. RIT-PI-AD]
MRIDSSQSLRLACVYLLFSAGWVLIGDHLIGRWVLDSDTRTSLQSLKGLAFVLLSSALIYLTNRHGQTRQVRLLGDLRAQTLYLRQAQRDADLGLWWYTDTLHFSDEALQILERPEGTVVKDPETFVTWLHPADRGAVRRALAALRRERHALMVNARLNRPGDQPVRWLCLRGEPCENGALGTLQDISAQKRDEEALRESEQRFRQLFEQTPRIAVQGYDRERRVIYWNQASEQLYGYSVAQAMGQRLEALIVPPALRERTAEAIDRWMIGGLAIPAAESAQQHRDGTPLTVYSSHLILHNRHDRPELYRVDIDLSLHKATHAALLVSERRHRQLVDRLNETIFLLDGQGCLSFLNPAWTTLSGHCERASLGLPLIQFFYPEDAARIAEQGAALLAGTGASWSGECRLRCAHGRLRWVELQLGRDEDNGGLRGSLSDIQAKYQALEIQEARNAVLDELLKRSPLDAILLNIAQRLETLGPHMHVRVMLMEADHQHLRVHASPSLPAACEAKLARLPVATGAACCGHAALSGEITIAEDIQRHPDWARYRELAARCGLHASWSLPFKDDAGQVLGTLGVYYNETRRPSDEDIALVTEFSRLVVLAIGQQSLQAERETSERRFSAIFEHAAVGIVHQSLDGRWLRVNNLLCQMLGYPREALLDQRMERLVYAEDLPGILEGDRHLLAGTRSRYALQARYRRADGSLLWMSLNATLVCDAQGAPDYLIAVLQDISAQKRQEEALRQAATVFESTREAVLVIDDRRCILAANPAFDELTGLSGEQALGQRLPLTLNGADDRRDYRELWRTLRKQGHWQGELWSRRADGSLIPLWLNASRVRDCPADNPQFVLVFTDISSFKESQERLARMAHYDPLTGLINRLYGHERLTQALETAHRRHERVAVLFLDLDHFKTINDSLGHQVGDELLATAAGRFRERLRETDILARLGGDEFLVVLENLRQPEEAARVARSLLSLMESPFILADNREAYLGASIGISLYPDDSRDCDDLIRNADAAMYQAKAEGRNTFRFYTEALTERARTRLELESRMRRALRQGEFVLHYQPLVDAASGAILGVEALLRWQTEHGLVSPTDFIPLAEDTGLIVPVGAWVLREACQQMQDWRQSGLQLDVLSVNLSPRQFRQPELLGQVRGALETSGLPAACLELEITEGALMDNATLAQQTLAGLKQLGVSLAVDDFGTGYSSLAYLRRFPLDTLKVDQSFLHNVPMDDCNLRLVASIVALGHSLDLRVIAEGVETPAQLAALKKLGCERCQGYLFSPPLPPDGFVAWLRQRPRSRPLAPRIL